MSKLQRYLSICILILLWILGGIGILFFGFVQLELGGENIYTSIAHIIFPLSILLLLILLTRREIKKLKE